MVYRIVYRNVIKYHELKRLIKYVQRLCFKFCMNNLVFRYNIIPQIQIVQSKNSIYTT